MATFIYYPTSIVLDFGGVRFTLHINTEFRYKLDRLARECSERSDDRKSDPDNFFAYLINELLGEGATKKIFGCDIPDVYQSADVITFICNEFDAFQNQRMMRYTASSDGREGDPA